MRKILLVLIILLLILIFVIREIQTSFSQDNISVFGYGPLNKNFYTVRDIKYFNEKFFVLDSMHFRVLIFDRNFNLLLSFGGFGDSLNTFLNPSSLLVDEDFIYVCDLNSGKVKVFRHNGEFAGFFIEYPKMLPTSIAMDSNFNLWITDRRDDTVKVFSIDNELKMIIGKSGSGKKEFKAPLDIITYEDKVYVLDSGNSRVQVFNLNGNYLYDFGTPGLDDGKLYSPTSFTFDKNGNLWIVEKSNGRIQIFNKNGEFIKKVKDNFGKLECIEKFENYMILYNSQDEKIYILDLEGNVINKIGDDIKSPVYFPQSIAMLRDGTLVVANSGTSTISLFDKNGKFIKSFSSFGAAPGKIQYPLGIAVNSKDEIFVLDTGSHVVEVYDKDGKYLWSFGRMGGADGEFMYPLSIAIGSDNWSYVTDFNARVQVFDENGKFKFKFGGIGSGDGQFTKTSSLTLDKYGISGYGPRGITVLDDVYRIYVCDTFGNRVHIFDKSGKFIKSFGKEILSYPVSIARYSENELVVLNEGGRLDFFTFDGVYTRSFGEQGGPFLRFITQNFDENFYKKDIGKFLKPEGILVKDRTIYITDTFNHRIQVIKFSQIELNQNKFDFGEIEKGEILKFKFTIQGKGILVSPEYIKLDKYQFDGKEEIEGLIDTSIFNEGDKIIDKIKIYSFDDYKEIEIKFSIKKDTIPPEIIFNIENNLITNKIEFFIEGKTEIGARILLDGKDVELNEDGSFKVFVKLNEGENNFKFTAIDKAGNRKDTLIKIIRDTTPPTLTLNVPSIYKVTTQTFTVSGRTEGDAKVFINGVEVKLREDGTFFKDFPLTPGYNKFEIKAVDLAGNEIRATRVVYRIEKKEIFLFIGKITSFVNGKEIKLDTAPFIRNGRTYVPLRFISESIGGTVIWDGNEKKVMITLYDTSLTMWVNKLNYYVNSVLFMMDSPPLLLPPGRVFVPIRVVSESLGASVLWDEKEKKITILYPK
ncbi:MAG: stalk domain-containing protein [Caldisericia bacterium]|nr:stalk domain-containing protein [Caldisericia bacterium]